MPERTCVGCSAVVAQSSLVRLVAADGALVVDIKGVMPGRGVYVCPDETCVLKAYGRKDPFSRALKRKVTLPDAAGLWLKIKGRI